VLLVHVQYISHAYSVEMRRLGHMAMTSITVLTLRRIQKKVGCSVHNDVSYCPSDIRDVAQGLLQLAGRTHLLLH
jgi:dTDP-4-dehydrorhamnose reductase